MPTSLDIEAPGALVAYLRDAGHVGHDERVTVRNLAGGVSNRTVLVEREAGDGWVVKQALAKLRVAVDWFSDPARIHREAAGLRYLETLCPTGSVTPLVFEDHEHHLFAMKAVPQPHDNWKTMLLAGDVRGGHVDQFAKLLSGIHGGALARVEDLAREFDDRSFFESLRLEPYYAYTAEQAPAAFAFLRDLIDQTRARRLTLVHGDYSPKNVLVHLSPRERSAAQPPGEGGSDTRKPVAEDMGRAGTSSAPSPDPAAPGHPLPGGEGRLVLLDHEVIHWGDPAFDLGFSLTHLLSKAHHLPDHRDVFVEAAQRYWRTYEAGVSETAIMDGLEAVAVRHTLACLLARVAGRSPLEYLGESERARQAGAVTGLMNNPPGRVVDLIDGFLERLA